MSSVKNSVWSESKICHILDMIAQEAAASWESEGVLVLRTCEIYRHYSVTGRHNSPLSLWHRQWWNCSTTDVQVSRPSVSIPPQYKHCVTNTQRNTHTHTHAYSIHTYKHISIMSGTTGMWFSPEVEMSEHNQGLAMHNIYCSLLMSFTLCIWKQREWQVRVAAYLTLYF